MTDLEIRLRMQETTTAAHIASCAVEKKLVWEELRGLKRAVWTAMFTWTGILVAICGVLLKSHLHL